MVFEQKSLSKDLVLCTQLNIPETVLLTLHLKRKRKRYVQKLIHNKERTEI